MRDGCNLYLRGDAYSGTMRFVLFRGEFCLMSHPPDDPNVWDGDSPFSLDQR